MTPRKKTPTRFGLALLGMGMTLVVSPVAAQEVTSGDVPERTTSSYLRSLAENPQSLSALMGAGRAALDLGDAQAALTFFGRAEEIAPRDGRIKMWIGSALVQLEQPATALRFFDDAKGLGVPEADLARDRGLAYDLSGDPIQAQRDYALALKQGSDPEVTRRMALSLAISGKKAAALELLDAQLKQHDRAAWRVHAFVLALTGDTDGASRAAQSVMPAAQAAAMAPFFARLPSLNMADRAMAVHFGRIAGDGRTVIAQAEPSPDLSAVTGAGRPDSRQTALGPPSGVSPIASSRLPSGGEANSSGFSLSSLARSAPNEAAPGFTSFATTAPAHATGGPAIRPIARTTPQPTALPPSEAASSAFAETPSSQPETKTTAATPAASALPTSRPIPTTTQAQTATQAQAKLAPSASAPPPTKLSMADIAAAIATLRDDSAAEAKPAEAKAKPAATPAPRRTPKATAATPAKAKPAEPPAKARPRYWVQVAGGASKAALPKEYARLKAKAPALFAKRTAWTTPLNATNRLLVGPFDSDKDARAFVNALAKADLSAFSWTSPAGQEIEKLPTK